MQNKFYYIVLSLMMAFAATSCSTKDYETVKNDPLQTRIYTLDNGLKVYMSVNKEVPRIQTAIAVRVGGKNDPAETTGLAHYFEHIMFKGTDKYGTSDYNSEKVLLDQIEQLFETYRKTTDPALRKAIYHQIDSVSNEASKYAIPNEYDKLMAAIGANGTNAFTGEDMTVYVEDIPSNQVENWAKIQVDRFKNCVIRGFHTELETVYEEYNMGLTRDSWKVNDSIYAALFPHHPYGTQTVIGTQEHLKNPSITNIKKYYKTWYVPNNMAICIAGDFNPEEMIATVRAHFGSMEPNKDLPKLNFNPEKQIESPIKKTVVGLEAANVSIGWRISGANSADDDLANIASSILYNGQAGLLDLGLNQQQKVLSSYCYTNSMSDYGVVLMGGRPKAGQTLEEVRDLLLGEVANLRAGKFDEALLKATIDNYKLARMKNLDTNRGRAMAFMNSFINGISWNDEVEKINRLSKLSKDDIVKFANDRLTDNSYAVVFKQEGNPTDKKIDKPSITPIATNRNTKSQFLADIQSTVIKPIEPVFIDFDKDMGKLTAKAEIPVLYKKNETTGLFELNYVFDLGSDNDAVLATAFEYLDYLGTPTKTVDEFKKEFYQIACSFKATVRADRCYLKISGLSDNMNQAMTLMEELITDAKPDEAVLVNLKADALKKRADAKLNQSKNFEALMRYAMYGENYVKSTTLSDADLQSLTASQLLEKVRSLFTKEHTVLYYGPKTEKEVVETINALHQTPNALVPIVKVSAKTLPTPENRVLLAEYNAKQIYYLQYANWGEPFNLANDANIMMYNEYFGGGMNSIVFQEMREVRGLAYSANAFLVTGKYASDPYSFRAFIATQNDKMPQAIDAFADIINNLPASDAAFNVAKEALMARMCTDRITKSDVLWSYLDAKDKGCNHDRNKEIYEKVQKLSLADIKAFQEKWIKNRSYTYCILGDPKELDMNKLNSLGKVQKLSRPTIFGY